VQVLASALVGAVFMYYLDPSHGRRRRALTRDRFLHAGRLLRDAGQAISRDAVHRTRGAVAEVRKRLRHEPVPDAIVAERVRAVLGRVVSHPHAIGVHCSNGRVLLSGPILEHEVPLLLACAGKVPGVQGMQEQLERHREAAHVSALQGGEPRTGDRFELFQNQWSPAARLLTSLGGVGLMYASLRQRGVMSGLLAAAGGGLLARSVTNLDWRSLLGVGGESRGIVVQKSININVPLEKVFEYFSNYQNFPRFMSKVKEVRPLGDNRSHWVVSGPAGLPVEWVSETTRMIPNQLIEWRSIEGEAVTHSGTVRFDDNGNAGTRVSIRMSYVPLAGALGHVLARLFAADPKSEMDADLMRMKTLIETGHGPHDAARPGAARSPSKGNGQSHLARGEPH
jgi:uncharacterized membrane protein